MEEFIDKFLKITLWIWLPFYALVALTRQTIEKFAGNKDGK